jgi:hypothetical protein
VSLGAGKGQRRPKRQSSGLQMSLSPQISLSLGTSDFINTAY